MKIKLKKKPAPPDYAVGDRVRHSCDVYHCIERGTVTRVREEYVFVKIDNGYSVPRACRRENLQPVKED